MKQFYKYLLLLPITIFFLTSCDKKTLEEKLVGVWEGTDGENVIVTTLLPDGSYSDYKLLNGNKKNVVNGTYLLEDDILSIPSNSNLAKLWGVYYNVSSKSSKEMTWQNDKLSEQGLSWNLTKKEDIKDNNSDDKTEDNSKFNSKLFGEWEKTSSSSSKSYYFGPKGKGYYISREYRYDTGIIQRAFSWETPSDGILKIKFTDSSEDTYNNYILEDGKLVFTSDVYTYTYMYRGNNYDPDFNADALPFDNYIQFYGAEYYEIVKVTSGCEHATQGANYNEKFLHFFGASQELTTTGLRIMWLTPYYDGIDATWSAGTYTMSGSSGAYKYSAVAYYKRGKVDVYSGGKLKITKSGNFTVYDFTDKNVKLHVTVKK